MISGGFQSDQGKRGLLRQKAKSFFVSKKHRESVARLSMEAVWLSPSPHLLEFLKSSFLKEITSQKNIINIIVQEAEEC